MATPCSEELRPDNGPRNPLIVADVATLKTLLSEILQDAGFPLHSPPSEPKPRSQEINTRGAKRLLLEKGYLVKSDPAFIRFVKSRQLKRIKRGKEYWYDVECIDNLPVRY